MSAYLTSPPDPDAHVWHGYAPCEWYGHRFVGEGADRRCHDCGEPAEAEPEVRDDDLPPGVSECEHYGHRPGSSPDGHCRVCGELPPDGELEPWQLSALREEWEADQVD